jgi:hypothetical protein
MSVLFRFWRMSHFLFLAQKMVSELASCHSSRLSDNDSKRSRLRYWSFLRAKSPHFIPSITRHRTTRTCRYSISETTLSCKPCLNSTLLHLLIFRLSSVFFFIYSRCEKRQSFATSTLDVFLLESAPISARRN